MRKCILFLLFNVSETIFPGGRFLTLVLLELLFIGNNQQATALGQGALEAVSREVKSQFDNFHSRRKYVPYAFSPDKSAAILGHRTPIFSSQGSV
jgi:hypothetical protein